MTAQGASYVCRQKHPVSDLSHDGHHPAVRDHGGEYFAAGQIPGFIHLSIGQEGSSTGVCSCLRPDDYVATTHRGHGHMIAKGADLKRMVAELFGKATGYCKGKGGSMHIADFSIGILGANGVVARGCP